MRFRPNAAHSAIGKLQALLIIDLIVVSSALAVYYYTEANRITILDSSEILLSDLTINQTKAEVGQLVTISVKATNIGSESGFGSLSLLIDNIPTKNNTIQLSVSESKIVEFTVIEDRVGNHTAKIGSLFETFVIKPPPRPAEFELTDLSINRTRVKVGEPVKVVVKVTNIGDESGVDSVSLLVNSTLKDTKTVGLAGGETQPVEFVVSESTVGTYILMTGNLTTTLRVEATAPPVKPAEFQLSNLKISPQSADPGQSIEISVDVTNIGEATGNYSLNLIISDVTRAAKNVTLSGAETATVTFTDTEQKEGTYSVRIGDLRGSFTIQVFLFSLSIDSIPIAGVVFTLNDKSYSTPYTTTLPAGQYIIAMPQRTPDNTYQFANWEDNSFDWTRTINLQSDMSLKAYYTPRRTRSCPSLYFWDGTNYAYRTEISAGTGWLGFAKYFQEDGSLSFANSYPWHYIKIGGTQMQLKNGYYDVKITQFWDEIFYLDNVKLLVVDHSPDVDVFSNYGTMVYNLANLGKIYTVSKNPSAPLSAVNEKGEDVLPQISGLDGNYTTAQNFRWNRLTLNLGNLAGAKEIKLIGAGEISWPSDEEEGVWISNFTSQPGVMFHPPPYMEVKGANGNWVRVPDDRQFPYLPATDDPIVVNLTGLFPTNDYTLRINTFFDARFDYIGIDTTPQQDTIIHNLKLASADLYPVFETTSNSTGYFTRYGDTTTLLNAADDEFVIGRQGDELSLKFLADMGTVPNGMERDYFVVASCWFKTNGLPFMAFTVDPMPFINMTAFPYSPPESYPYDAHSRYIKEYNTRKIGNP